MAHFSRTVDEVLRQARLFAVPAHPFGEQRVRWAGERVVGHPVVLEQGELTFDSGDFNAVAAS